MLVILTNSIAGVLYTEINQAQLLQLQQFQETEENGVD